MMYIIGNVSSPYTANDTFNRLLTLYKYKAAGIGGGMFDFKVKINTKHGLAYLDCQTVSEYYQLGSIAHNTVPLAIRQKSKITNYTETIHADFFTSGEKVLSKLDFIGLTFSYNDNAFAALIIDKREPSSTATLRIGRRSLEQIKFCANDAHVSIKTYTGWFDIKNLIGKSTPMVETMKTFDAGKIYGIATGTIKAGELVAVTPTGSVSTVTKFDGTSMGPISLEDVKVEIDGMPPATGKLELTIPPMKEIEPPPLHKMHRIESETKPMSIKDLQNLLETTSTEEDEYE